MPGSSWWNIKKEFNYSLLPPPTRSQVLIKVNFGLDFKLRLKIWYLCLKTPSCLIPTSFFFFQHIFLQIISSKYQVRTRQLEKEIVGAELKATLWPGQLRDYIPLANIPTASSFLFWKDLARDLKERRPCSVQYDTFSPLNTTCSKAASWSRPGCLREKG